MDGLRAHVGLVLRLSVQPIEQQDIHRVRGFGQRIIREHVGRHRRKFGQSGHRAFVLLKHSDFLELAIFGDLEVFLAQLGNRLTFCVGHDYVQQGQASFHFESKCGFGGIWRRSLRVEERGHEWKQSEPW
jgi:hypothetical protein